MNPMTVIAGPCVMEESEETWCSDTRAAGLLADVTKGSGGKNQTYFKVSWRKANRTNAGEYEGVNLVNFLRRIRELTDNIPGIGVVTDVHEVKDVDSVLDWPSGITALQIPAFLSRQNALIEEVCRTGLDVVVKKGPWMGSEEVSILAEKLYKWTSAAQCKIIVDRGVVGGVRGTRGGNYAVDMYEMLRSAELVKQSGVEYIFDLTHTYGERVLEDKSAEPYRTYVRLVEAATALGCTGFFAEVSSNPTGAGSDSNRQMSQESFEGLLNDLWLREEPLYEGTMP